MFTFVKIKWGWGLLQEVGDGLPSVQRRHGARKEGDGVWVGNASRGVCVRVKGKWERGARRGEDMYVNEGMAQCRRQDLASGQANSEDT